MCRMSQPADMCHRSEWSLSVDCPGELKVVRNKILVLSGKDGVGKSGKSTVTALLSRAMAQLNPEKNYGVLDVDICGPSQPRVLGVLGEQVHQSGSGWSPVYVEDNLSLMSIGFLLGSYLEGTEEERYDLTVSDRGGSGTVGTT